MPYPWKRDDDGYSASAHLNADGTITPNQKTAQNPSGGYEKDDEKR